MTGIRPTKTAAELFGVPVKPRNARDRLLITAIDLFYGQGFNAVGLDLILRETGVTKTTFYKHFESKDQLLVEAIRRRDEWETRAGNEQSASWRASSRELNCWRSSTYWTCGSTRPDFHGCLFINAAAEFPNPHDPVHQVAAGHKRRNRDEYRDLAARAGAADPESFADRYALLIEGTLVLRHVHHRNDAARVARPMALELIDTYLPCTPRKPAR